MTFVLRETVLAEETLVAVASVEGEYLAPAAVADSGRKGELDQSGMWSETSTKGSTADLLTLSSSLEYPGRGSC